MGVQCFQLLKGFDSENLFGEKLFTSTGLSPSTIALRLIFGCSIGLKYKKLEICVSRNVKNFHKCGCLSRMSIATAFLCFSKEALQVG